MRRARLGLCIGDREYGDRFTSCLMNHYRDQLELHMFSQKEALQENWKTLDAIVLSDDLAGENRIECEIPQIYLFDGNENVDKDVEKGVVFVVKLQEVNKIVDGDFKTDWGGNEKSQWGCEAKITGSCSISAGRKKGSFRLRSRCPPF